MSKMAGVRKNRGKDKKGTGQFKIADTDPKELDVRKTRRGTYAAPSAPSGTTWKSFMQKYNDNRRTPSPSSQFQTTSTEAMDTDEAQKVTTEIVKTLMEKQKGDREELPPTTVDEEQETVATMEEIEKNLAEKKKQKEMEDFLASTKESLNDSEISFKSIPAVGDSRADLTEELDDTVVHHESGVRPSIIEDDFEQTIVPEPELTEELNKKKPVPKMTYVSSDGTADPSLEERSIKSMVHLVNELRKVPLNDFYLPLLGNPPVKDCKMVREEITPRGDSIGMVIEIPQWEKEFDTRLYGIDRKYGMIYAIENGEWGRIVKACNAFPQKELEDKSTEEIVAGLKSPKDIKSPESQAGVPVAESTRKKEGFHRVTIKDLGASHSDMDTIGLMESSTDAATSSEENTKIQREIEETERVTKALEEERLKIEKERSVVLQEQHEMAKERLVEAKKRRIEVIKAIVMESEALQKQKEMTIALKRKKRSEIYHKMTDQLNQEEEYFNEYLKGLSPNYAGSDVFTHESDLPSEWDVPRVGEEPKVALLWAEYARIESHLHCLEKEFQHHEKARETTIGSYIQYGRRKERTEKKLNDLKRVIFQYQDDEDEKERLKLIQEDPENSAEVKDGRDMRDRGVYCIYCNTKDHPSYPYCSYCKTHEHALVVCPLAPKEKEEKVSQLGVKENTQPPKKKKKVIKVSKPPGKQEQEKEKQKVLEEIQKITDVQPDQGKELHWDYGDDPKAREIFEKHYVGKQKDKEIQKEVTTPKVKTTTPNIYCEDCKRNHWGPCKCVICDETGHDEDNCPTYQYALHLSELEFMKGKMRKKGWTYCERCMEVQDHSIEDCPKVLKELPKPRRDVPYCHHCDKWGHEAYPFCKVCGTHTHTTEECDLGHEE